MLMTSITSDFLNFSTTLITALNKIDTMSVKICEFNFFFNSLLLIYSKFV